MVTTSLQINTLGFSQYSNRLGAGFIELKEPIAVLCWFIFLAWINFACIKAKAAEKHELGEVYGDSDRYINAGIYIILVYV